MPQAIQPCTAFFPILIISVSMPSPFSVLATSLSARNVLPFSLGLPLISNTLLLISYKCYTNCYTISAPCPTLSLTKLSIFPYSTNFSKGESNARRHFRLTSALPTKSFSPHSIASIINGGYSPKRLQPPLIVYIGWQELVSFTTLLSSYTPRCSPFLQCASERRIREPSRDSLDITSQAG